MLTTFASSMNRSTLYGFDRSFLSTLIAARLPNLRVHRREHLAHAAAAERLLDLVLAEPGAPSQLVLPVHHAGVVADRTHDVGRLVGTFHRRASLALAWSYRLHGEGPL